MFVIYFIHYFNSKHCPQSDVRNTCFYCQIISAASRQSNFSFPTGNISRSPTSSYLPPDQTTVTPINCHCLLTLTSNHQVELYIYIYIYVCVYSAMTSMITIIVLYVLIFISAAAAQSLLPQKTDGDIRSVIRQKLNGAVKVMATTNVVN